MVAVLIDEAVLVCFELFLHLVQNSEEVLWVLYSAHVVAAEVGRIVDGQRHRLEDSTGWILYVTAIAVLDALNLNAGVV